MNKDNFLKCISAKLQALIPVDTQTQMAAGYRDSNLRLTDRGVRALLEILAEDATTNTALTAKAQVRVTAQTAKATDENA